MENNEHNGKEKETEKEEQKWVKTPLQIRRERANVFLDNPPPVCCDRCGGNLESIGIGAYQCVDCGEVMYDKFRQIRNYLEKVGPKTVMEIAEEMSLPRREVLEFVRQERLEVSPDSTVMLTCSVCGMGIRTGFLCERCKKEQTSMAVPSKSKNHGFHFIK